MNKVQKLLLDIKKAEAKLEYAVSRKDEDDTLKYLAGWSHDGNLLVYGGKNLTELSLREARQFAHWILDMSGEVDETIP